MNVYTSDVYAGMPLPDQLRALAEAIDYSVELAIRAENAASADADMGIGNTDEACKRQYRMHADLRDACKVIARIAKVTDDIKLVGDLAMEDAENEDAYLDMLVDYMERMGW